MFDFETVLSGIEFKSRSLADKCRRLENQVLNLTEEKEELSEKIKKQTDEINELKEEIKILKLRNTLAQKGDAAEIKLKINQLIRNIDKSIEYLSTVE